MTYPTLWRGTAPSVWGDLLGARREFDLLLDRFADRAADTALSLAPSVDVRETAEGLEVTAELAGIRPEDVSVSIENNLLTISGEKKHEVREGNGDGNYHLLERRFGRFERTFTLPRTVDTKTIDARFEHGVLTVTLPKSEAAKPRKIKVSVTK